MRRADKMLLGVLLAVGGSWLLVRGAVAQPFPERGPDDSSEGTTSMPVSLPGGTEVMGTEQSGSSSSQSARLPLEKPVDPDSYICGPGDVFELNFWGKQNFRLRVTADLEGRVFISKVGFLAVQGKTLTAARAAIVKKVKRYYPGLQLDIALTEPRTFLVHVVDYVAKPGAYVASPLERVSSVLARAGGVTGSRRRIEIRRTDGSEVGADLVRYELTGDTQYNPYVLDGDVIRAPFADPVVSITGPVHRPGTYELVGSKDLTELLDLAGGFTSSATHTLPIRIVRANQKEHAAFIDVAFSATGVPNRPLQDEDRIVVPSKAELQRSILLVGAVAATDPLDTMATSTRLPYVEGDSVRSLIDRAGGITAPGDLHRSYISRSGGERPELIPIDLEALLVRRDFSADKPIHMGDTIVVPRMRRSILVDGAVTRAGLYDYNPRFGVPEYVVNAGGRTRTAKGMSSVQLVEPSGKARPYKSGMEVRPGDTIMVPERGYTRSEVVQLVIAGAGLALSAVALTIAATR